MVRAVLLVTAVACTAIWIALVYHTKRTNPDGAVIIGLIAAFPFLGGAMILANIAFQLPVP